MNQPKPSPSPQIIKAIFLHKLNSISWNFNHHHLKTWISYCKLHGETKQNLTWSNPTLTITMTLRSLRLTVNPLICQPKHKHNLTKINSHIEHVKLNQTLILLIFERVHDAFKHILSQTKADLRLSWACLYEKEKKHNFFLWRRICKF